MQRGEHLQLPAVVVLLVVLLAQQHDLTGEGLAEGAGRRGGLQALAAGEHPARSFGAGVGGLGGRRRGGGEAGAEGEQRGAEQGGQDLGHGWGFR